MKFNWFGIKRKPTVDLPMREVSTNEPIDNEVSATMDYIEVELSDCEYGCKIYENQKTGERVLAHNSTYGCNK